MSSRNAYLSDEERLAARALPRASGRGGAGDRRRRADAARARQGPRRGWKAAGFDPIDYVALRDAETLAPLATLDRPARLLAAARIGRTRLIDNLPVTDADQP